jgi:hypothetical protein
MPPNIRTRATALQVSRRQLHRLSTARRKGTDRGRPAQAVGKMAGGAVLTDPALICGFDRSTPGHILDLVDIEPGTGTGFETVFSRILESCTGNRHQGHLGGQHGGYAKKT